VIYDSFMFADELDILECRLTELQDIPDLKHVIIEAGVSHRGEIKPFWYADNKERFSAWADRIIWAPVDADELPSLKDNPDPWSRELAQREFAKRGLADAHGNDLVLHGDCDEIPSVSALQEVSEKKLHHVVLQQRLCQYAVDWVHPYPWHGTIATRARTTGSLAALRGLRNALPRIGGGGSHLSWMGGTDAHIRKLGTHCHLEMTRETEQSLRSGEWLREGRHSDGHKLEAADVDETWPRWVWKRECPGSWFRPRDGKESE
jgi:glycosyl transferase family 17